ncbi:MAG: hypothetical protein IJW86_07655 [Clostridia bacterium]|nr:hypothetical protein [Clostridia bacterium]
MKSLKKILTPVIAILLVFAMTFSAFASVGTQVNARDLFVASKAERVVFDALDVVINGLVNAIASFIPTPKYWFDKEDVPGFMQGTEEFLDKSQAGTTWSLGYDSRSLLPENKEEVIGKYNVAGTIGFDGKLATGVEDDLLVRTVALNDSTGRGSAVFAVLDSYGLSLSDVREIRTRLADWAKENGINSITVSVLHQHSAVDTFGMNGNIFRMVFLNPARTLFGLETENGKSDEYMENLFVTVVDSIKAAFGDMTEGDLFYGTADATKYIYDKRQPYVNDPNFNRLRFVPDNGSEETWIVTSQIHCVGNGASGTLITGDYPYYAEQEINSHGANVLFVMGAEQCNTQEKDETTVIDYTPNEIRIENTVGYGKSIAKDLIAITEETEVTPLLNIRYKEILLPLTNSILLLAGKAGLFENIIRIEKTDYFLLTEIGYMEIGDDLAFAIVPGELAPELAYGGCLTSEYSWSGEDWQYPSMQEIVAASGSDRALHVIGLANDQIGYIVPDNNYMSMIHEDSKSIEFVSLGKNTASNLIMAFEDVVNNK